MMIECVFYKEVILKNNVTYVAEPQDVPLQLKVLFSMQVHVWSEPQVCSETWFFVYCCLMSHVRVLT